MSKKKFNPFTGTLDLVGTDCPTPINTDTKEPTGFVNRTDSVLSFDQLTRTLTISPVISSFDVYVLGTKITISSPLSISIPSNSGEYYFYIDAAGTLHYATTFSLDLITSLAYASYIYWNATDGKYVIFGDERHGIVMDGATHSYLHRTLGTQYISGGNVTYTLGNGNANGDMQIALGNLTIADEDITVSVTNDAAPNAPFEQVLSPIAKLPIWYRLGPTEWHKSTATNYPLLFGTTRSQYNSLVGSNWTLTDAPSNNKILVTYVFGTTGITEPVVGILGQAQYQTLAEAKIQANWQNIDFGSLPAPEMVLLYIIFYETSTTYNNSVKSRIVDIQDFRFVQAKGFSASQIDSVESSKIIPSQGVIPSGVTGLIESIPYSGFFSVRYFVALQAGSKTSSFDYSITTNNSGGVFEAVFGKILGGLNYDVVTIVSGGNILFRITNNEAVDLVWKVHKLGF